MDLKTEQLLQMMSQPAFYAENGVIQWQNRAADCLVYKGQDISHLFADDKDLYDLWDRQGPMQMDRLLMGTQYVLKVCVYEEGELFVLEQRNEDPGRYSKNLLQTSSDLRRILQDLLSSGIAIQDEIGDQMQDSLLPEMEELNRCVYRLQRLSNLISDNGALMHSEGFYPIETVNIRQFLIEFCKETADLLKESGYTLHYTLFSEEREGHISPQLLKRALCHLLSYSIKHSEPQTAIQLKAWETEERICISLAYRPETEGAFPNFMGSLGSGLERYKGMEPDVVRLIAEFHGGALMSSLSEDGSVQTLFSIGRRDKNRLLRSPGAEFREDGGLHSGLVELSEILSKEMYHPDRV